MVVHEMSSSDKSSTGGHAERGAGARGNNGARAGEDRKVWFFITWWKYPEDWKDVLSKDCKECTAQEEVCPTTGRLHVQGNIRFKNAKTLSAARKYFKKLGGADVRYTRDEEKANKYCSKEETRREGTVPLVKKRKEVVDRLEGCNYYKWQWELLQMLEEDVDARKIYWVYDPVGGRGKTRFMKHLCLLDRTGTMVVGGKAADIRYGVAEWTDEEDLNLVMVNTTREQENFISYTGLEEVKDGVFYSTKFKSKMALFNEPHIVVFSNFEPKKGKMTEDRWVIMELDDDSVTDSGVLSYSSLNMRS